MPDDRQGQEQQPSYMDVRCDTNEFLVFARAAVQRDSAAPQDIDASTFVSAPFLLTQELHDCQRLIENNSLGTLAALFVSADRVSNSVGFIQGKVVGEVIAYDGPYAPLRIAQDRNCLWLKGDPASTQGWVAAIHPPAQGSGCAQPFAEPPETFPVQRIVHTETGQDTVYPSTGRWMWDATGGGRQFVGVRCGDAWCEFGPAGYRGTRSIAFADSVPGWYDEQLLSYLPAGTGTLQLSGLLGRIAPADTLRKLPDSHFHTSNGAHIATITLTGTDSAALTKYRKAFDIPAQSSRAQLVLSVFPPVGNTARQYRSGNGPWRRVQFNPHAKHAGSGAVRWHWYELDEKAWFPCGGGCCVTDEIGI